MRADKSAMNLKNFSKTDLFKPESFLLFYLAYILITVLSFFSGLPIKKPSLLGFAVIFATFPFFLLGVKFGKRLHGKKIPQVMPFLYVALSSVFYALVVANFYKINLYLSILICFSGFAILYLVLLKRGSLPLKSFKGPAVLMLIGAASLLFSFFQIKGVPLLNPSLKIGLLYSTAFGAAMLLFIIGFSFLMPQIKSNKKFLVLLILGTALFLLSLYRGATVITFLTGVLIAYYAKKFDTKKIFLALIILILIIFFVGYLARPILSPAKLFLFRAGTTHVVFDEIVQKSMPFGYTHGTLFFKGNPRDFVGTEIMGGNANLTYTILGQAVLDFGIAGAIVWMFILGAILKIAHLSMKAKGFEGFYPLLFSVSLVFIEIGADQFFLLFYFVFLMAYIAKFRN